MIKKILLLILASILLSYPGFGENYNIDSRSINDVHKDNTLFMKTGYSKIPLYFIPNKGQVNEKALFYAQAKGYTLWLTRKGLVFDSINSQACRDISRLIFIGSKRTSKIMPIELIALHTNYFIGNNESKWLLNIPTSKAILYKNIYNCIDLKIYGTNKQIEYDWKLMPGSDHNDIKFTFKDVKSTHIDKQGNLIIKTKFGELIHKKPISYQITKIGKKMIRIRFKEITKNTYKFIPGKYDKKIPLIIDPVVLINATYLGGKDIDRGNAIAVDNSGNIYITGSTRSTDFPINNQYSKHKYKYDVFVTKFSTAKNGGMDLVYSTFLGGSGESDEGYGITADNSGKVYISGLTHSRDFPLKNQFQDELASYEDAFLTKLDTTKSGEDSLVYSTYLGGQGMIDNGRDIAVNDSGVVYMVGLTNSKDFPIKNQFQDTMGGGYDAFIAKIDTNLSGDSSLLYSTFLGGSWEDCAYSVAIDNDGNVYVGGATESTNFPIKNQYQGENYSSPYGLLTDGFLTKLDTNKSGQNSLVYSTYLNGKNHKAVYAIAADNIGNAYVCGGTGEDDELTDFHYADVFITKLNTVKKGVSSHEFTKHLRGKGLTRDCGSGIAFDNIGDIYVTGYTYSPDFPVKKWLHKHSGGRDAFVTKLDIYGKIIFSTYLGGTNCDSASGITLDNAKNIYIVGRTNSTNFPTKNPYQYHQGEYDTFIAKLSMNADIEISKSVDNKTPAYKSDVIFTIKATNNGPAPASDILVNDTLPQGLVLVSVVATKGIYNSTTGIWDIGSIAANNSAVLTITARIMTLDPVTNIAEKTAQAEHDPVNSNDLSKVTISATQIILNLGVTIKYEKAWIVNRKYAQIDLAVKNPQQIPVEKFLIYRSKSDGQFILIKEFPGSQLINGSYSFNDLYLKKNHSYKYKATALDSNGKIIGSTQIKSSQENKTSEEKKFRIDLSTR